MSPASAVHPPWVCTARGSDQTPVERSQETSAKIHDVAEALVRELTG